MSMLNSHSPILWEQYFEKDEQFDSNTNENLERNEDMNLTFENER